MKTGTLLLIAAVAFLGYEALQLNTASNTLQVIFNGVQINGPLNYTLNFIALNVSNATVNLNSLAADVTINGNDLGEVTNFTPIVIQPNAQTPINVTLQPSVLSIPGTVQALLNQPTGTFDFKITGNMNVNSLVLPLNLEKTITV